MLALVSPTPADDAKKEVKKDLDRLQGTWTVMALTYNGEDSAAKVPNLQFKIEGDVLAVVGNDEVKKEYAKMQLVLDPATKPKLLDFKVTGGTQKDATIEGIYELKDDELTICAKVLGKDRPTKFESPAGQSVALLVLKREK
jgi:uncharacterized protein (TIGR03067 family)